MMQARTICTYLHGHVHLFFLHIYSIQVAMSPTSLHHPPLTVTTSVTTTINETTATTVTIINATTNTTLDSVTRPPPSPTSTGQSPQQQSQQQQLDGCSRHNMSRAPGMSFSILLPLLLLMILFQSVIFTIHHSPFTITIPHHKSNIEKCTKNTSTTTTTCLNATRTAAAAAGGLEMQHTHLEALVLFSFFFYILLTTLFCVDFIYTHHLASNSSSRLETQGMFNTLLIMSTETTYYPTNNAGYPNWPRTRDNMHEKGPNDSRVIWTFFF